MSNRIKDTIRRYAAMALSLTVVICFCFIGTPGNIFTTAADSSKELSNAVDPDMIYPGLDDLIRYPHDPGYVKSGFGGFRVSEAENGGIRFSVSGGRHISQLCRYCKVLPSELSSAALTDTEMIPGKYAAAEKTIITTQAAHK